MIWPCLRLDLLLVKEFLPAHCPDARQCDDDAQDGNPSTGFSAAAAMNLPQRDDANDNRRQRNDQQNRSQHRQRADHAKDHGNDRRRIDSHIFLAAQAGRAGHLVKR